MRGCLQSHSGREHHKYAQGAKGGEDKSTERQSTKGKPHLKVLYLFCGLPRKPDVRQCLIELARKHGFKVTVHEVDIERSSADDLSRDDLWAKIHEQVSQGDWDVVVLSPSCNTYSRVRMQWRKSPGPRPIRNASYSWGFPWLGSSNRALVELHNSSIRKTLELCFLLHACGRCFLVEHPEDLGAIHGERPASIWQLDEMKKLAKHANAVTWAIHQCEFGASTTKPTRFLSNMAEPANNHIKAGRNLMQIFNTLVRCQSSAVTSFILKSLSAKISQANGQHHQQHRTLLGYAEI